MLSVTVSEPLLLDRPAGRSVGAVEPDEARFDHERAVALNSPSATVDPIVVFDADPPQRQFAAVLDPALPAGDRQAFEQDPRSAFGVKRDAFAAGVEHDPIGSRALDLDLIGDFELAEVDLVVGGRGGDHDLIVDGRRFVRGVERLAHRAVFGHARPGRGIVGAGDGEGFRASGGDRGEKGRRCHQKDRGDAAQSSHQRGFSHALDAFLRLHRFPPRPPRPASTSTSAAPTRT